MLGVLDYPRVSVIIRGNPVMIENAPFHRLFTDAQSRGLGIDVWTVEPWATVYEGQDSGDTPTAWVYRWQTIAPVVMQPGDVLDVSNGPLYLRLQNPGRDLTATHVGNGEAFLCLMPDGSSYQVGGVESNGAFLRGFARGAIIWAVVVATAVYTAGVVSDYGVIGAVAETPLVGPVEATGLTVVDAAPALVGPVEAVATTSPGWTFSEVIAAGKTVAAGVGTVKSVVAAVQTAITTGSPVQTPQSAPAPAPAPAGSDSTMLIAAGIAALFLIG